MSIRKPLGKVQINWQTPHARGLVAAWVMNPEMGFRDLVGNHHGTIVGQVPPSIGARRNVYGYQNDGNAGGTISDHGRVACGDAPADDPIRCADGKLTIVFRARRGNDGPQFGRIIDISDGGDGLNGYTCYVDAGTSRVHVAVAGQEESLKSDGSWPDNTGHHHCVATYDEANTANSHIWINGVETGYVNRRADIIPHASTQEVDIGNWNRPITQSRRFTGEIDYILIYNRLFNEAEAQALEKDKYLEQLLKPVQPSLYIIPRPQVSLVAGSPTITNVTPSTVSDGETNVVITGTNFGAAQGTSTVDVGGVTQTGLTWSDTSITIPTLDLTGVPDGTALVRVDVN